MAGISVERLDAIQSRWQFSILRVEQAPFQHRAVSRHYHAKILADLQRVAQEYSNVWQVESSPFPLIFIQLFGTDGRPVQGLAFNVENYPHRAMSVYLTDATCRRYATQAWFKAGDTGRRGVFLNQKIQRFWFCTPGTDEYHSRYHDVEPFDRVRGTKEVEPLEVLLRCIRNLDVPKATEELTKGKSQGEPT